MTITFLRPLLNIVTVSLLLFTYIGLLQDSPIEVKVLHTSGTVSINGKHFVYSEVMVINGSEAPVRINSAEITTDNGSVLYHISNEALQKLKSVDQPIIPAGDSAVYYFDIPCKEEHRRVNLKFKFNYTSQVGKTGTLSVNALSSKRHPVVLSAPLRGSYWTAIYNSDWQRGHRRVYYKGDGQSRIPGRFAIDFVQLDEEGRLYRSHADSVKNYYSFGADVLAVADGTIVSVLDSCKESKTISGNAVTQGEGSGNYISLEIMDSTYVFYEHLKPGSITVKVGDKVKTGQVLAKVGFTGDASEPHLHLHVADRNSVLGAEGLSFHFKDFTYQGVFYDFSDFGKRMWSKLKDDDLPKSPPSRPMPNSVIDFVE